MTAAGFFLQWIPSFRPPSFFPWQPDNFPYKDEIAALSNVCLVLLVLLFISCILGFKVAFSYSKPISFAKLLLVVSDLSEQHDNSCEFHSRCSFSFRQADVGTWMHHQKQHIHELPYHFVYIDFWESVSGGPVSRVNNLVLFLDRLWLIFCSGLASQPARLCCC